MARFFAKTVFVSLLASAAVLVSADGIRGDATSTGINVGGGTCSFANYTLPRGIYGTGLGAGELGGGFEMR